MCSIFEKSKETRARLQASSIENVESYMQTLSALEEELKIAELKNMEYEEVLNITTQTALKQFNINE